jgi:hypothetical protein
MSESKVWLEKTSVFADRGARTDGAVQVTGLSSGFDCPMTELLLKNEIK